MRSTQLSTQHLAVWNTLQDLKTGERILGRDLMAATGITSERVFFSTIEQLREMGYHIGAKRNQGASGYYVMTSDEEVMEYLFRRNRELENEIDSITNNAESFFKNKYGDNFDFIAYKAEEELKRNDN